MDERVIQLAAAIQQAQEQAAIADGHRKIFLTLAARQADEVARRRAELRRLRAELKTLTEGA